MKTLLGYFWRGCLVLVPVAVTAYFAFFVISTFDKLVPVGIPGLGFVLTVLLITLIGFLTSNVIGQAVWGAVERRIEAVPLLKLIYGSIRDLLQAFVGNKKRFDRPVALSLGAGNQAKVLGFITRDNLADLTLLDQVAVYVPQSYNFAGNLLIVPKSQVEPLQVSSTDLMAFIVSGGVSGFGAEPTSPPPPKPSLGRTMLGLGSRKGGG